MGIGGIWQWVIVLVVILLLFGTKRLRNLGSDLGHAVKGFRKGVASESEKIADEPAGDGKGAAGDAGAARTEGAADAAEKTGSSDGK